MAADVLTDHLLAEAEESAESVADALNNPNRTDAAEAFVSASVPYNSDVVTAQSDLEELKTWLAVPSAAPGTSALIDTTTAITLTSLLSGEDLLTPLTLWDLSRAITAIICYDNLFHFAHREVDDDAINRELGVDVFRSLPLPTPGVGYDRQGVRGLFNRAWTDTDHLMDQLSDKVRGARRATLEGREVDHLARQWSIVLGRQLSASDVIVDADYADICKWASPGAELLKQIWDLSGTTHEIDEWAWVVESREDRGELDGIDGRLRQLIRECNYRGHVNERLANHLQLPYVANTARLPFKSRFYEGPRLVSAALPSVLAMSDAYALRAAQADLLRGDPLVLPVFLALVLRNAARPVDIWGQIAQTRKDAARYRERRSELDQALAVGDQARVKAVRTAIGTEAASLTTRLVAAGGAAVSSVAADPVALLSTSPLDWLKPGLAALIAATRRLLPTEVAHRLIWRLCRPELRFMSDITMDSRAVIDSLPNVQRLWGLADADADRFAKRIDGFRTGLQNAG